MRKKVPSIAYFVSPNLLWATLESSQKIEKLHSLPLAQGRSSTTASEYSPVTLHAARIFAPHSAATTTSRTFTVRPERTPSSVAASKRVTTLTAPWSQIEPWPPLVIARLSTTCPGLWFVHVEVSKVGISQVRVFLQKLHPALEELAAPKLQISHTAVQMRFLRDHSMLCMHAFLVRRQNSQSGRHSSNIDAVTMQRALKVRGCQRTG